MAFAYAVQARNNDPQDLSLRDAEHALHNLDEVKSGAISKETAYLLTIGYTVAKVIPYAIQSLFGTDWGITKPTLNEIKWGLQGADAGARAKELERANKAPEKQAPTSTPLQLQLR